jgi:hypothetical protein
MDMHNPTSPLGRPDKARAVGTQKAAAREFLTFRLGAEEYGIDMLRAQEIRSYEEPTRIASVGERMLILMDIQALLAVAENEPEKPGTVRTELNEHVATFRESITALREESTAAAESLRDQASRLTEAIRVFRIDPAVATPAGAASVSHVAGDERQRH